MATTTTGTIKLKTAFQNDDTASIELGPFDSDAVVLETLRTNIKNFDAGAISDTYVSEAGSPFAGITEATYTVVKENEINLNE